MSTTQNGYTPLLTAARCGKCDVVIELLDSGADINTQSNVSLLNTIIVYTSSSQQFLVSSCMIIQSSCSLSN